VRLRALGHRSARPLGYLRPVLRTSNAHEAIIGTNANQLTQEGHHLGRERPASRQGGRTAVAMIQRGPSPSSTWSRKATKNVALETNAAFATLADTSVLLTSRTCTTKWNKPATRQHGSHSNTPHPPLANTAHPAAPIETAAPRRTMIAGLRIARPSVWLTNKGFIRAADHADSSARRGTARINPVGRNRVAGSRDYGDCKAAPVRREKILNESGHVRRRLARTMATMRRVRRRRPGAADGERAGRCRQRHTTPGATRHASDRIRTERASAILTRCLQPLPVAAAHGRPSRA
jgi:hypothetical protein